MTGKNKESQEQMQSQPRFADYHKSAGNLLWLLLLGVLSYVAYQYNIVLFLVFALLPFWLISKSKKISKKAKLRRSCWLSFFMWFIVNALILKISLPLVARSAVGNIVSMINVLSITWVNFVIFVILINALFNTIKSLRIFFEKQKILVFTTIVLNLLILLSLWKDIFTFRTILLIIVFSFLYSFILVQCFSKRLSLVANFLFPVSICLTSFTAIIIVFFIIRSFHFPEEMRDYCTVGLTYLSYFQITSISSILIYFLPDKYFSCPKLVNKGTYFILLFIILSIGICLQNFYYKFLVF